MDGQGWHCSRSKGENWGEVKARLQAAWGVWETQRSGTKALTSVIGTVCVVCAHCIWWGGSVQGSHSWLQILSFTHTQFAGQKSQDLCDFSVKCKPTD